MFWVPESEEINLLIAKDRIDFDNIINTKRFTVRDSSLTYRQANSMAEDNMLPDEKDRGKGWRKFSFKELVYIELVLELKKFGIKHAQLKSVWDSFFKKYKDIKEDEPAYCEIISDDVIAYVMGHIDILLTITADGEVDFLHPVFFTMMYTKDKPFIFVSMSDIVNRIFKRTGKPEFSPKATLYSVNHVLTDKEENIINILRKGKYKSIKISIKDGQADVLHAEKPNENSNLSIEEVVSKIENGKYQKVSVTKRDGKIVNILQEDTIKV
ncbi:hypothetical protein OAL67_00430 [bacterium]|nr:hypothetical protein [bacterium]